LGPFIGVAKRIVSLLGVVTLVGEFNMECKMENSEPEFLEKRLPKLVWSASKCKNGVLGSEIKIGGYSPKSYLIFSVAHVTLRKKH
jgi:hypothetical protein